MEKEVNQKMLLLLKDSWSIEDIMSYESVKKSKAYEIRKRVQKSGGAVKFNPHRILVDKYFELKGVSRAHEIEITNLMLKGMMSGYEKHSS
jgi:hypothetical protein